MLLSLINMLFEYFKRIILLIKWFFIGFHLRNCFSFEGHPSHYNVSDYTSNKAAILSSMSLPEKKRSRKKRKKDPNRRCSDNDSVMTSLDKMLLETSLNALRMKRFNLEDAENLDVLKDDTLQDLTSLFTVMNKVNNRMAKVAYQAINIVKGINTMLKNARNKLENTEVRQFLLFWYLTTSKFVF